MDPFALYVFPVRPSSLGWQRGRNLLSVRTKRIASLKKKPEINAEDADMKNA